MNRTASANQTSTTTAAATFKPVSSTVGILTAAASTTDPTTTTTTSSGVMTKSELYSNCISQLQSTHNAIREAHNLTNFTGSLSPITTNSAASTTIAPILVRTNKLNHSQTSIHSSTLTTCHQPIKQHTTMSTFSPSVASSSPSSTNSPQTNLASDYGKKGNFYTEVLLE